MLEKLISELQTKGTISFKAKITPKSGRHEISGFLDDGTIKVKLKAAPEQGKANEELIELLSETFNISRKNIAIISGHTSPLKKILISK